MALKVHHLRPAPGAKTAKTRVGRGEGGKGGKTAGRGTKGTGARKGTPQNFEGGQMPLHMRVPKLRGFKNPFRVEYQIVNLSRLGELFPQGGAVDVDDLVAAGAVRDGHPVKVLGQGDAAPPRALRHQGRGGRGGPYRHPGVVGALRMRSTGLELDGCRVPDCSDRCRPPQESATT